MQYDACFAFQVLCCTFAACHVYQLTNYLHHKPVKRPYILGALLVVVNQAYLVLCVTTLCYYEELQAPEAKSAGSPRLCFIASIKVGRIKKKRKEM